MQLMCALCDVAKNIERVFERQNRPVLMNPLSKCTFSVNCLNVANHSKQKQENTGIEHVCKTSQYK
jgi:hypothetical protein